MLRKNTFKLLLLATLSSVSFAEEIPERKSDFTVKSERLKAKAQKQKRIPVIIRLKAPFKPEGKMVVIYMS